MWRWQTWAGHDVQLRETIGKTFVVGLELRHLLPQGLVLPAQLDLGLMLNRQVSRAGNGSGTNDRSLNFCYRHKFQKGKRGSSSGRGSRERSGREGHGQSGGRDLNGIDGDC